MSEQAPELVPPAAFPAADDRPSVIAVANQKGGVGKTTTAVNLAAGLAAAGRSTLLIDLDPQGNASTGLGIDAELRMPGSYAVLMGQQPVAAAIRPTALDRLHLMPAEEDLAGADIELVGADRREFRLRDALTGQSGGRNYVLIDCPPSLTLLTLNALVAADSILIPMQCEFFALEGISQITRTVERVRRGLNPNLRLQGIVLTMFDRRNNLSELVATDVRSFFGDLVYETAIPRNIRISEAPSHGMPVLTYDPRSAGAQAYVQLAAEVMARETAVRDARS